MTLRTYEIADDVRVADPTIDELKAAVELLEARLGEREGRSPSQKEKDDARVSGSAPSTSLNDRGDE